MKDFSSIGRNDGQIREGCCKNREECDAQAEKRHFEIRQRGKGRYREEPEASDRDWPFGSTEKGREGSKEEIVIEERRGYFLRLMGANFFGRGPRRIALQTGM